MPTVSIIIPAYNHERYIRDCIDGALSQTYRDFEIMVVDDGSSDGTSDIVRSYGNKVTLIEQSNSGTQAARNRAIRASSGAYIALLDSDDVWLPHKLQRQMEAFESQPRLGMIYAQAYSIDEQGNMLNDGRPYGVPIYDPACAFEQILILDPVPTVTVVIKKACLDEMGLFEETFVGAADWDLWLRIAAKWQVFCVEEPLALYRVHQENTTKHLYRTRLIYTEHKRVLERALAFKGDCIRETQAWNKAWAQAHLVGAEVEVLAGNLTNASTELASALSFDPGLAEENDVLMYKLVAWAHMVCKAHKTGKAYQSFVDQMFAKLDLTPSVVNLKKRTLSTAAMSVVFSNHSNGEFASVRSLLPLGLQNDPRWIKNRGVWSIAAKAFLGTKVANRFRRSV